MTHEEKQDGTVETLRGVAVIVAVGVVLGLAFNALGLASRPPRGLSWITKAEKLPSLEELQPGSGLVPVPARVPDARPSFALVGTAWAQTSPVPAVSAAMADLGCAPSARPARTAAKPDTVRTRVAPDRKAAVPARKVAIPARKTPVAAGPARRPAAPAPAIVAPPVPVKVDLPLVPDLDQPIEVRLANAKKFFDAGAALFVDAREAPEYAEGHIAGALSVPFDEAVKNPALLEPFKKAGKPLILYCSGGDCELSKDLARNMLAEGIRKVLVFTDGLPAWKAAGYPMEAGVAKAAR
jgi:rhodanese-related sulfurtransferase